MYSVKAMQEKMANILLWQTYCYGKHFVMANILLWQTYCYDKQHIVA